MLSILLFIFPKLFYLINIFSTLFYIYSIIVPKPLSYFYCSCYCYCYLSLFYSNYVTLIFLFLFSCYGFYYVFDAAVGSNAIELFVCLFTELFLRNMSIYYGVYEWYYLNIKEDRIFCIFYYIYEII
jgi:hypothetical protein